MLWRNASAALCADASLRLARSLLADAAAAGLAASELNPGAVLTPVGATTHNLHPVMFPGEHTAVGLSMIDFWTTMLSATAGNLAMRDGLARAGVRREHALWVGVAQVSMLGSGGRSLFVLVPRPLMFLSFTPLTNPGGGHRSRPVRAAAPRAGRPRPRAAGRRVRGLVGFLLPRAALVRPGA